MNIDDFINKMFNETIEYVLEDVDKSFVDEVKKNYLHYLKYVYKDTNLNDDKWLIHLIEKEKNKWLNNNSDFVLSVFVVDNAFKEIEKISDEAYDLAVKKALGEQLDNISISKITEKRLILKRLLPEVKYFNVGLATQLVNDTLLDFEYIMGNTILCSLRVGHIIAANDKKNNK